MGKDQGLLEAVEIENLRIGCVTAYSLMTVAMIKKTTEEVWSPVGMW